MLCEPPKAKEHASRHGPRGDTAQATGREGPLGPMAVIGLKAQKHTGPRKARSYAVHPAGTLLGNRGISWEQ